MACKYRVTFKRVLDLRDGTLSEQSVSPVVAADQSEAINDAASWLRARGWSVDSGTPITVDDAPQEAM